MHPTNGHVAGLSPACSPHPASPQPQAPHPSLPHELAQHILILAAHTLVIDTQTNAAIDLPNAHALAALALVLPDNDTALHQFVHLNVPWCSFHAAAARGNLRLMRWWLRPARSGMHVSDEQYARALYEASRAGHDHVLYDWQRHRPKLDIGPSRARAIMMGATEAGQLDALDWLSNYGFDPEDVPKQLRVWNARTALSMGRVDVADWWMREEIPLIEMFSGQYPLSFVGGDTTAVLEWLAGALPTFRDLIQGLDSQEAMLKLSSLAAAGRVDTLQWILDYCRKESVPVDKVFAGVGAVQAAAVAGQLEVLKWWKANDLQLTLNSPVDLDEVRSVETLAWIAAESGWVLTFTVAAVDAAESTDLLDWWLQHCGAAELKYTELAMDRASSDGRVNLLDWWLKHSHVLQLRYSSQALDLAAESGEFKVFEWWVASDLELKIHTSLACAARGNHLEAMQWLYEHELFNKGAEEYLALSEAIHCRNFEAFRWIEALPLPPLDDKQRNTAPVKSALDQLVRGGSQDVYGLQWWIKHSTVLDQDTKDWLIAEQLAWFEGEGSEDREFFYASSDEEEETERHERWQADVDYEIPDLDVEELEEQDVFDIDESV